MEKELDVLFVSAPSPNPVMVTAFEKQSMPPLGLGYIATYLKSAGYSSRIIDMGLKENNMFALITSLKKYNPKVLGISCTTETYKNSIKIAKLVKQQLPQIVIVFGGPHVTFEYKTVLADNDVIDFVELGEGEYSFKRICDYIIRKSIGIKDLKGVAYKIDNTIVCTPSELLVENLDALPFPDRSLYDLFDKYAFPATVSTSRGCPGKCVFCAASGLSGGRYRMRSAKNVVDEFEYLKSLGYSHVVVVDDTMTVNKHRLDEFINELILRKLVMTWYCESRVDIVTREMLLKMKAAGLTQIQFGVESGSQEILNSVKKGITLEKVRMVFKWCKDMHIQTMTNLIIGQPEDTNATIECTIQMAEELINLGAHVSFTVCTPFPGTAIWNSPDQFGLDIIDHNFNHYTTFQPVFNTKYLTALEIRNAFYLANKRANNAFSKAIKQRMPIF